MTNTTPTDWMDAGEHVQRRILSNSPDLMTVEVAFETGGEGAPHHHHHTQSVYVASGRFRFILSGETRDLAPGDALLIPSNAVHSCVCLEGGTLIDAFSPRRDDFVTAHGLTG